MHPWVAKLNGWMRQVPILPLYMIAFLPAIWLWYHALTGGYPEPIKKLEHRFGMIALQFFVASLMVTPLLHQLRLNLVRFRRMIGLMGFYYLCMHFGVWLVFDLELNASQIANDLTRRPYIVVGMIAFVLLIPVALTSNDWAIRKLQQATWHRIHWWVYPAIIGGGVHYLMQSKAFNFGKGVAEQPAAFGGAATALPPGGATFPVEPTIYLLLIVALVAYRPIRKWWKHRQRAVA